MTVGGVIFSEGRPPDLFGERVPQELVSKWRSQGGKQVIGQAELMPVNIAARLWRGALANSLSIWFIDQDASSRGLTKGYSPVDRSSVIIDAAAQALAEAGTRPWFARVNTGSNPADAPLRLEIARSMMDFPGAMRARVSWGEFY